MSRASTKFREGVKVWQVLVLVLVLLIPIVYARPTPVRKGRQQRPARSSNDASVGHNSPGGTGNNPSVGNNPPAGQTPPGSNSSPAGNTSPAGNHPSGYILGYEISYPDPPADFHLPGYGPEYHPLIKWALPGKELGKELDRDNLGFEKLRAVRDKVDAITTACVEEDHHKEFDDVLEIVRYTGVPWFAFTRKSKHEDSLHQWYPSYELKPGDDVHFKVKIDLRFDSELVRTEKWLVTAREKKGCTKDLKVVWKKVVDVEGAKYPVLPEEEEKESGSWQCSVM
ncbi:hypothetical protein C8R42DRAFT_716395 [Lentinula raphanica]|nr:hypothetical protein C8R42DRAFT_716395 [Lentinula raphanica]